MVMQTQMERMGLNVCVCVTIDSIQNWTQVYVDVDTKCEETFRQRFKPNIFTVIRFFAMTKLAILAPQTFLEDNEKFPAAKKKKKINTVP